MLKKFFLVWVEITVDVTIAKYSGLVKIGMIHLKKKNSARKEFLSYMLMSGN